MVQRVGNTVLRNRRVTFAELELLIPGVTHPRLFQIFHEKMGCTKICGRWVPKMLTDELETQRITTSLEILQLYHDRGPEFLKETATGDETWMYHGTAETKRQSPQWKRNESPRTVKFRQTFFQRKVMALVFWNNRGILLVRKHNQWWNVTGNTKKAEDSHKKSTTA